jgi:hypothetical protein
MWPERADAACPGPPGTGRRIARLGQAAKRVKMRNLIQIVVIF